MARRTEVGAVPIRLPFADLPCLGRVERSDGSRYQSLYETRQRRHPVVESIHSTSFLAQGAHPRYRANKVPSFGTGKAVDHHMHSRRGARVLHILRTTCQSYRHKEAAAPERLSILGASLPASCSVCWPAGLLGAAGDGNRRVCAGRRFFCSSSTEYVRFIPRAAIGHGPSSQAGPASAKDRTTI